MSDARVFRAADNTLYLVGGSNNVTSLYTREGFDDAVDCAKWRQRLDQRKRFVASTGARFAQIIVPEKMTVYPLKGADLQAVFPGAAALDIVPPGRRLAEALASDAFVYPEAFLREQTNQLLAYPKTDSHWSWKGAFSTFQVLMFQLGVTPDYNLFVNLPKQHLVYRGDLWEPGWDDIPAEQFERIVLPESIKRIYVNALMGLKERLNLENEPGLHVGSHCIFLNDDAQFRETVLLFGSSFSEARLAPSLLTAIFSFYFRSVHFIWSSSLDLDYIRRHPASLVVAEIPERFTTECPSDDVLLENLAVTRMRRWAETVETPNPAGDVVAEPESGPVSSVTSEALAAPAVHAEINMPTVAALTMAYNERHKLPRWIDYYGRQLGTSNCFIIDHGSDDGSTDGVSGPQIVRVPRTTFDNAARAEAVSGFSTLLLRHYDYVIYTDCDEIVVADPAHFTGLGDFCNRMRPQSIYSIGIDIIHSADNELELRPNEHVTTQRSLGHFSAAMCKPNLIKSDVSWSPGFHSNQFPPTYGHLFNFHLRYADLNEALDRLSTTRNISWANLSEATHQLASNNEFETMLRAWSLLPIVSDDPWAATSGRLKRYLDEISRTSFQDDPTKPYRLDTFTFGNELLKIDQRFIGVF